MIKTRTDGMHMLWCDRCGCAYSQPFPPSRLAEKRKVMAEDWGWAYKDGRDMCDPCRRSEAEKGGAA